MVKKRDLSSILIKKIVNRMWHVPKDGDPPGQLKQFIRCCVSCEYVYVGFQSWGRQGCCPKCGMGSYGAPFVYGGWIKSFWRLLTQKAYREKKGE